MKNSASIAPAAALPEDPQAALRDEFGPVIRNIAESYFEHVRFPDEAEAELRRLHQEGFVVHVMRTTSWINYVYLAWAMVKRRLPPIRAVVNLVPWWSRPWRRTAQRGEFDVRFMYARRHAGSGLIFLKRRAWGHVHGKDIEENPFPALVAMARKSDRNVFLVPELFVWEKWTASLKPSWMDYLFGSPEAPNFLHTLIAFWRNYKRAQFRLGDPIDLKKFIAENPGEDDERLARKIKGALTVHLAKETRAVFGPPYKSPERLIEETLRDRTLRRAVEEEQKRSGKPFPVVLREARRHLKAIASRQHPTFVGLAAPVLDFIFQRIYEGIDVDERGLERAMRVAGKAPIVLCPSHKSHVDYLVLGWVLWKRGYNVPLVAAGSNLAFFPLGFFLRRIAAFFLRRSFKDDKLYTAAFKAYVKKLIRDGIHQEFFPEGGRSRNGKLLPPRLGLLTWQVDAVLEGARDDLYVVPVSIDYERVVESRSYSKELAGGEKKAEDFKALLTAPKVLTEQYGRIALGFDEPISLREAAQQRGLTFDAAMPEADKRSLIRNLGNRIMYGISRVSTVTPHALAAAALLGHGRRGATARELTDRIHFLRRIAEEDGIRLSKTLQHAPSDPTVMGPVQDAFRTFSTEEMIRTETVGKEVIYQAADNRRPELSFSKNTLMNLLAGRAMLATAVLVGAPAPIEEVKARTLFLSRLFKVEFIYRVGVSFDAIFDDTVEKLVRAGLLLRSETTLAIAPEPHARPELDFLAHLVRDFVESYLVAALTLEEVVAGVITDKKAFVKEALERGRADFLSGKLSKSEALSKTNLDNAIAYLLDQQFLAEKDKKLSPGPRVEERQALIAEIRRYLA